MEQYERLIETVRFLMASTKKLSDAFQDSESRVRSSFRMLRAMSRRPSECLRAFRNS